MGYSPRFDPQLGRGIKVPGATQGSMDCGPRTWRMGIDSVTKGDKRPGISQLRSRGGVSGPQTTNIWDAEKCVESYDSIPGRKPLTYTKLRTTALVKKWARQQRAVHLCIHYGVWNQKRNGKTGDPNFTGGHSVLIKGQRFYKGIKQWLLFDPLEDSRRSAIQQGPRWVRASDLVDAAKAFGGGNGNVYAGLFGGGGVTK